MFFNRELTPAEIAILANQQMFCCGVASNVTSVCNGRGACNSPDKVRINKFLFLF